MFNLKVDHDHCIVPIPNLSIYKYVSCNVNFKNVAYKNQLQFQQACIDLGREKKNRMYNSPSYQGLGNQF